QGTPQHFRNGRLDTPPYPGLLLAAMGQLERTAAQTTPTRTERPTAESRAQFQRGVAHRGQSQLADGFKQRGLAPSWILNAIRPCGHCVRAAAFNRRMRKTARPVVWEGAGAQSPALDPIDLVHGDVNCRTPAG